MYDDIRYGIPVTSTHQAPLVVCMSQFAPTRAPKGKHTLYLWHYEPYSLKDGGVAKWEQVKEKVADSVLETVRTHTTIMGPENIIARTIYSPTDYEKMNPNLVHGAVLGPGAFMYQFFSHRPFPELGQYRCPTIESLYFSGQAFHPGGGITGGGRATVQVVMEDLGIDFEKVIS